MRHFTVIAVVLVICCLFMLDRLQHMANQILVNNLEMQNQLKDIKYEVDSTDRWVHRPPLPPDYKPEPSTGKE